jgi:ATP-dependent Lon protease
MTTPQNELYNLSYKVKRLTELFETEEDEQDIFTNVKQLYTLQMELVKRMDALQDQMALIIKLLGKEEYHEDFAALKEKYNFIDSILNWDDQKKAAFKMAKHAIVEEENSELGY